MFYLTSLRKAADHLFRKDEIAVYGYLEDATSRSDKLALDVELRF